MSTHITLTHYSSAEEAGHALSHGIGLILSIAGLSWMLSISIGVADPWRIVASSLYGASLILLFLASTMYHGLHASPKRDLLKLLDHCSIYLLIAGTYTPFLLVAMRTTTGWWLFGITWTLAAVGILTKLRYRDRYPRLSLASYLIMGWLVVFVAPQVKDSIGTSGMSWLVAGGLCYSVGAIFYAAKQIKFHHVIWHLFVLAGAACHLFAVVWYVLPVT